MEKKNSMMLIIITIAAFVVITALATYAYFATNSRIDANIGVNVETAGASYTFTASGNGNINLPVTAVEMSESNVSSEKIKSGTGDIKVSLASPSNDIITSCTYDIIWVWDSEQKYTTPDVELPYISDEGLSKAGMNGMTREQWNNQVASMVEQGFAKEDFYAGMGSTIENGVFLNEFSAKVQGYKEKDLSKMEAGTTANSLIIQKGVGITAKSTTAVEQTHTIEANIYNLPVVQTNLFDKNFKAHLTVENVQCTMTDATEATSLATHLTNTVYNSQSNQTSITGATPGAGLYKHTTTLANSAGDDSYRYAGADADVNNWVCFAGSDCSVEDNLYRIISVDSTNKTKIIKATNSGMMQWNKIPADYDESYNINEWQGSILETYLSGEYLQGLGTKVSLVDTTTWSVGGVSFSEASGKNVHDFMALELANPTTYTGKVGLMYAYEYGYAALPEYWTNSLRYNSSADDYRKSLGHDWMFTMDYPWTILRSSDFPDSAFLVVNDGIVDGSYVANANGVRPVFGLVSDVKLLNATAEGVGTKANPMIIV